MNNDPNQAPMPPTQPEQPIQPPIQPVQPIQPVEAPQVPPAAPMQPQPPAAPPMTVPVAPAPVAMPTPPTVGSGPKKGLIIGIIAGVVGLVVVVAAIMVAVSLLTVSKADYEKAYSAISDVRSSYNDISSVYVGSTSTSGEIKNAVDKMEKEKSEFDTDMADLSDLKAIKSDKEVHEAYQKLSDKKPKFDAAMNAAIEAYDKILPAVSEFSSSASHATSATATVKSFRQSLEGISGLQDDNNKEFIDEMVTTLTKLQVVAAKVDAGRADYRKYDSSAFNQYYDLTSDLSTSIRDWQSNLGKLADDGEIRDEINDLSDLLSKRAAGLKD